MVRSREKKLLPRVGAAEELYVAPIMSQSRGTIQVKKVRLRLSNKNERNSFGFEEHQDHRGFKTSRACTNSNPLSLKEPKSPIRLYPHIGVVQEFVDSIVEQRPPKVGGEEGRAAVEICQACLISARTGQAVDLPLRG